MRYEASSSIYRQPVISPAELLVDYPDLPTSVPHQLLTVKAYESPDLTARALNAASRCTPDYVIPLVLDDSETSDGRHQNQAVAGEFDAEYYPVKGENSFVRAFSNFLEKRGHHELARYLGRIVTSYPRSPDPDNWGGTKGAQNAGHLLNVMKYGQQGVREDNWLSTFIDQDVVIPPTALNDTFPLIAMYHHLGVGMIASGYTHHLGSPLKLSARALEYLAKHVEDLPPEEINQEIRNIIARAPTVGLQTPADALARYTSSAARNFDFPSGNYTLSGIKGFTEAPVSTMGHEDQGYGAMLQLFVGAKEMGVARVPDFIHIRKPNAPGAVHGDLISFLTHIGPRIKNEQNVFLMALLAHAQRIGIPRHRTEGFSELQESRHHSKIKALDTIVRTCDLLRDHPKCISNRDALSSIRYGAVALAEGNFYGISRPGLDFASRFIRDALSLQPHLVEKAYAFGATGHFDNYAER